MSAVSDARAQLAEAGCSVSGSDSTLDALSTDFGGLVRRAPALAVAPRTTEQLLEALRICARLRLPICTRGAGHSQSGQGLAEGAVVIELTQLQEVIELDRTGDTVEVSGGTRWVAVFEAAWREGRLPVCPTFFTEATVGGTLSVAGVGSESWRVGAQVNNVMELEVATLDGALLRCSAERHRELFDAVRGGLGQVGVIVRARYPLRRCGPQLHCRAVGYRSAEALLTDIEQVKAAERPVLLFAAVTETGLLLVAGAEQADWLPPLAGGATLEQFASPTWALDGSVRHPFWRGYSEAERQQAHVQSHPWVDHLFDRPQAVAALERLAAAPPTQLSLGSNALIAIGRGPRPAPLLRGLREQPLTWGLGVFPNVDPPQRELMARTMADYSRAGCAAGGVRYLSGFVPDTAPASWAAHYGPVWSWFQARKRDFDPHRLLNPGFIEWGPPP